MRVGRRFLAPLLLRRFPPEVPFGFLGQIAPAGAGVEVSIEARRVPGERALALAEGARSVAEAELVVGAGGPDRAQLEVERDQAHELGLSLAGREQELWTVGLRLVARGPTRAAVEAERLRLSERLAGLGFATRVPRYEVAAVLRGRIDGAAERHPPDYLQTLTTDGVAALFPFSDETVLDPSGILVGLSLSDASPVFLDRWGQASHSWALFGTTGSGKSFAAALTLLRSRWMVPELEVVVLDPLGEYGSLVRALGGEVVRLADDQARTLNPLDPATTGGDRREKAGRVAAMLRALFPSVSDEEAAVLDATVSHLYADGATMPSFARLARELATAPGTGRLRRLLEVFLRGSLRFVDGPTTLAPQARTVGFDFAGVPSEQLAFHLAYVLDWTYGRIRGRDGPKLVIVDEAHLLVREEATAAFLDRLVRHMRHFRAGVLLLTQSPDDFLAHPSGQALLRNLYATAFLRLPEVSEASRAFFGLGKAEAEWLPRARLPREAGYSESLWRVGEWHLPLAVVASTPEFELLSSLLHGGSESTPSAASGRRGL